MDHAPPTQTSSAITFDLNAYLPYLEDHNITEADKEALLKTLWSIVLSMVDLGFEIHPLNLVDTSPSTSKCSFNVPSHRVDLDISKTHKTEGVDA